uniref:Uncharacterized protein n=1 Tax=Tetranychus urticae TaxID=32264 RepID=T1KZJ6_TETUR
MRKLLLLFLFIVDCYNLHEIIYSLTTIKRHFNQITSVVLNI